MRLLVGFLLLTSFSCGGNRNAKTNNDSRDVPQNFKSSPTSATRAAATKYERNLPAEFPLPDANDFVSTRILKDYGAIFVARGGVVAPPGKLPFRRDGKVSAA